MLNNNSNENNNNSNENNRGYCFIEFNNAIEARKSFKILNEKKIILNKFLTIDWAKGLNKENDINKFQLFIKGITNDININKLYEIFSIFGKINFIKLARDSKNNNNKNNDYGFITFDSEKDAENALKKGFDSFSAIILDAYCKLRKNNPEQEFFVFFIFAPPLPSNVPFHYAASIHCSA